MPKPSANTSRISESDMFEVEYWSLEQAKLGKSNEKVPGAAGGGDHRRRLGHRRGDGARDGRAGRGSGDPGPRSGRGESGGQENRRQGAGRGLRRHRSGQRRAAFDQVVRPLAASISWSPMRVRPGRAPSARSTTRPCARASNSISGRIRAWRRTPCASCRRQGTYGCLLFNTSKQAVNPGKDFGPYGLPKAATLFLVKQYALDHGKDGIRSQCRERRPHPHRPARPTTWWRRGRRRAASAKPIT